MGWVEFILEFDGKVHVKEEAVLFYGIANVIFLKFSLPLGCFYFIIYTFLYGP